MTDSRFLKACQRQEVDCTPVWFMRQAGRYLEEYRRLRQKYTLLEICRDPKLAAEATMQPIRRFNLDAAIIFADILLPLQSMGCHFEFTQGEGPIIHHPIRSPQDIQSLTVGKPEKNLGFVFEAIRLVCSQLDDQIPLIGFAGAPFTVASYMIEGGYSRNFLNTKLLMYKYPEAWHQLMTNLSELTTRYLKGQIEAGVQAVQLFDSWVGCLAPQDYRRYVLPYSKVIFDDLKSSLIPTIHFGTGTATLLELMKEAGGTVMSVDWRIQLQEVWNRLGNKVAIQGNLDPVALLSSRQVLKDKVSAVLEQAGGRSGYIFNLGHGVLPQTPEKNVESVVQWVHDSRHS